MIRGIAGYGEHAVELIERYESLPFAHKHDTVLRFLPNTPTAALDIGAGTGADAAWLAGQGHQVVAVEPTEELRQYGIKHHVSPRIEWVNDSLPLLERVKSEELQCRSWRRSSRATQYLSGPSQGSDAC